MKPDPRTQKFIDEGLLIEAGFVSMISACGLSQAPLGQLSMMRDAFFGGAAHLLHSIMAAMEEGEEATDADMNRLNLIQAELDAFHQQVKARALATMGRA